MEGKGILAVPAEGPQFVEACHVVEVRMGVKDSIDGMQVLPQGLLAEIGAAVDEDGEPGHLQMKGRAGALVARMAGGAYRAVAANYRNPHRSAGAKQSGGDGLSAHGGEGSRTNAV
jgi:hypothetical protein